MFCIWKRLEGLSEKNESSVLELTQNLEFCIAGTDHKSGEWRNLNVWGKCGILFKASC